MSYPTGLHAVSYVLSRMCVTTSVCPFFKGASCPIESYMRKEFPALTTMKDVCLCGKRRQMVLLPHRLCQTGHCQLSHYTECGLVENSATILTLYNVKNLLTQKHNFATLFL